MDYIDTVSTSVETTNDALLSVARVIRDAKENGLLRDTPEFMIAPFQLENNPEPECYLLVRKQESRSGSDRKDQFLAAVNNLPEGELKEILSYPADYPEVRYRAVGKKDHHTGNTNDLQKFWANFNRYGIDKPTDEPMGGPYAVWFAKSPHEAFSHGDKDLDNASGIKINALMAYDTNNIGIVPGTNFKADGEGFINLNGDTRSFKERLKGAILVCENYSLY